jgi:hypothetical protein
MEGSVRSSSIVPSTSVPSPRFPTCGHEKVRSDRWWSDRTSVAGAGAGRDAPGRSVEQQLGEFLHPGEADPVALLHSERVLCWFEVGVRDSA